MTASAERNSLHSQGVDHHGTLTVVGTEPDIALSDVSQALHTLRDGQVLLVVGDLPNLENDLFTWVSHTNNQILAVDRSLKTGLGFYILKGDPWPVDVILDTQSAPCPTPVVMSAQRLAAMRSGQYLRLATTCHAAVSEMDAWLRFTRHRLLGITEDARGVYRFYIRKV